MKTRDARGLFLFAGAMILAGTAGTAFSQENYTLWSHRKVITVNTAAAGANVTADVVNFPLLVRLGPAQSDVFTVAKTGGADLRFTKADSSTRLKHQIEFWDSAAGTAAIWVRMDSVKGNNAAQSIRMYWGKADAMDSSQGAAVFDTANGYVGVWHMGGTGNVPDATINGLTGVEVGSVPSAEGILGQARSFSSTPSANPARMISVAHDARLSITQNLTVSAWIHPTDWSESRYILNKGSGQGASTSLQYALRDNSSGSLIFENTHTVATVAVANPTVNEWHLLHGTYGGGQGRIYLNGALITSQAGANNLSTTTHELAIGMRSENRTSGSSGNWMFNGRIDEVRVQKILRDSNYIKLEFATQRAGQTAVTLAATQGPPVPENYAQWTHTSNITINTSAAGMNVTGNVLKFPYLVRLDSTFNYTQSIGRGVDVRFSKTNGAHLKYQRERWDSAGKKAYFWVLLDTVYGNNATQAFRMHWGRAGVPDSSSGQAVFDTVNGFQVVYHMDDSVGNVSNSTLRPYTGVNRGTPGTTTTAGAIGRGRAFNSLNSTNDIVGQNWIEVTNNGTSSTSLPGLNMTSGSATMSAWIRNTSRNYITGSGGDGVSESSFRNIIAKRDRLYLRSGPFYNSDPNLYEVEVPRYEVGVVSVERVAYTIPAEDANGLNWIHLAGVKDSAAQAFRLYRNGVSVGVTHTTPYLDVEPAGTRWIIGSYPNGDNTTTLTTGGGRVWIGDMDEIRIQNKARDANWIKLEYMNQKSAVFQPAPSISYTPATAVDTVGRLVNRALTSTAGLVDAYSISPAFSVPGLTFSTTTGLISGFATAALAATAYTVTATGPGGTGTATLNLTIVMPTGVLGSEIAAPGFSVRPLGKGLLFGLPAGSAPIEVSIQDLSGRTVWSRTSASAELVWDGLASNGRSAGRGVYIIRMSRSGEPESPVFKKVVTYSP